MDHYRTQQSYEELIDNQVEEEMPIELENLQTMGHCLRPMFECLPEKYRQAMILSELDGLPQQTVADPLGLSLSATKSQIQRGRVKLKALLVEYCNVEAGRGGIVDSSPESRCLHMAQMYSAEVA